MYKTEKFSIHVKLFYLENHFIETKIALVRNLGFTRIYCNSACIDTLKPCIIFILQLHCSLWSIQGSKVLNSNSQLQTQILGSRKVTSKDSL